MKHRIIGLLFILSLVLIGLPSCNKGYGCKATEGMQSSGKVEQKKSLFKKKDKTRSGRLFK